MSVDSNIGTVWREFAKENARRPQDTVSALNKVAFEVRQRWVSQISVVFKQPTAFTKRSPLYEKATLNKLTARVYIRDKPGAGPTAPDDYLNPQVFGGRRPMKPSERALGHYYVPGFFAKLDRNGVLNVNTLRAILNAVGGRGPAFPGRRTGGARRNRGKKYFVLHERSGKLPAGVYERAPTGVKLILIFVSMAPQYQARRFDAFVMANTLANNRFPEVLDRQMSGART